MLWCSAGVQLWACCNAACFPYRLSHSRWFAEIITCFMSLCPRHVQQRTGTYVHLSDPPSLLHLGGGEHTADEISPVGAVATYQLSWFWGSCRNMRKGHEVRLGLGGSDACSLRVSPVEMCLGDATIGSRSLSADIQWSVIGWRSQKGLKGRGSLTIWGTGVWGFFTGFSFSF